MNAPIAISDGGGGGGGGGGGAPNSSMYFEAPFGKSVVPLALLEAGG